MFEFIKTLFGFGKEFKNILKEQEEKNLAYIAMSTEELSSLPDDELFEAAFARTEAIVEKYDNEHDGVCALNDISKHFYVSAYYEMEVNNGGINQFFVNSSRYVAPELSVALEKIGAFEHKSLFDNFITENKIDLVNSAFYYAEVVEDEDWEKYDIYDDAFYALKPISEYLTEYIKNNIAYF